VSTSQLFGKSGQYVLPEWPCAKSNFLSEIGHMGCCTLSENWRRSAREKVLMVARLLVLTRPRGGASEACSLAFRYADGKVETTWVSDAEFVSFLSTVFANMTRFSSKNSVHYVFMDWRHADELLAASKRHYASLLKHMRLGQGQWRDGQLLPFAGLFLESMFHSISTGPNSVMHTPFAQSNPEKRGSISNCRF